MVPRWLAHLLVSLGWLLTPLWAWGASFVGAAAGARVAASWSDPVAMTGFVVALGATAGLGALWIWVRWMRRVPHLLARRMTPRPGSKEEHVASAD